MTLPVTIPNTFANATTSIPLANLDANFTTIYNAVNGIGNGSEALSNVTISGGTISNVTLDNVTVDVETLSNVTITNLTVNGTANLETVTAATIGNANITSVSVAFPNSYLANSNVVIGGTTIDLGDTASSLTNVAINFEDQLATRPTLKDYSVNGEALGVVSANATLDFANANFFSATANANLTFSFANASPANTLSGAVVALSNGGAFTLSWANVDWTGGVAPSLTANGLDLLVFVTYDAGTTIHGMAASLDSK
jgi:hypothetical protein